MFKVFVISLSGVMAPGPITTATLVFGAKDRSAGLKLALGHAAVEFPLIAMLMLGAGAFFTSHYARIVIGLAGGGLLAFMALQMYLITRKNGDDDVSVGAFKNPFTAGAALSAGNPYFLVWWATVGLALALQAKSLGVFAILLFAIVHWMMDAAWLWVLSTASFKGAAIFSAKVRTWILLACAAFMLFFGVEFIVDAVRLLIVS